MTRIGLISDTHGTFDDALKLFLKDVDEIWHAGDIGSAECAQEIAAFKPLRAVYGNIDNSSVRYLHQEFTYFKCEDVSVLMTHIGGYPRHYQPKALQKIQAVRPKIFISEHSHILRVIYDNLTQALRVVTASIMSALPYALLSTELIFAIWK